MRLQEGKSTKGGVARCGNLLGIFPGGRVDIR